MTTVTMSRRDETVELLLGEESNLRCLARGLTRCESDSDELVQETLLRAYRAKDRFRPGSSMRAWTTTILRRLFFTSLRRAKICRVQTETDAGGALESVGARPSAPCDDMAPDIEALGEGLDDAVKHALDRVPGIYRTAFLLSVVREMSCAEIGHALRVPVGTVMSRVHRARERLREELVHSRHPLSSSSRKSTGRRAAPRSERAPSRAVACS